MARPRAERRAAHARCVPRAARASTPGSRRAPRSPRTTTRCSPRSSRTGRPAPTRSSGSRAALAATRIEGVDDQPRPPARRRREPDVRRRARLSTSLLAGIEPAGARDRGARAAGRMTTVQDHPGRLGYWAVGVPPCGPMDDLSFRLGNRLVGNDEGTAGLELHRAGPALLFHTDATVCLAGAPSDRRPRRARRCRCGKPVAIAAGRRSSTSARSARRACARTCSCAAGIDVAAGARERGHVHARRLRRPRGPRAAHRRRAAPRRYRPRSPRDARRAVDRPDDHRRLGDRGARRSARRRRVPHRRRHRRVLRDRLARAPQLRAHRRAADRPEPAVGAPRRRRRRAASVEHPRHRRTRSARSTSPATCRSSSAPTARASAASCARRSSSPAIAGSSGSSRPEATVRFVPVGDDADARRRRDRHALAAPVDRAPRDAAADPRLVAAPTRPARGARGDAAATTTCSSSTGRWCSISSCASACTRCSSGSKQSQPRGIVDVTPGIRSLQVHFDADASRRATLLDLLAGGRRRAPADRASRRSRAGSCTCRCPGTTRRPARRSTATCRRCAPTRRGARGTSSSSGASTGSTRVDDVKRIVYDASYLVLGLGDVYLGAPVATPLDPRHRLVTTKYNPARTWTPENAVGIGGAYLCIYGMEGPGGYQFVGRTVPVWNRFRRTARLHRAVAAALLRPAALLRGRAPTSCSTGAATSDRPRRARIEHSTLRLADHLDFVRAHAAEIGAFRARQQDAFNAERGRWAEAELAAPSETPPARRRRAAAARARPSSRPACSRACGRSSSRSGRRSRPATRSSCSRA